MLQQPWWMLHPCQTAALLQLMHEQPASGHSATHLCTGSNDAEHDDFNTCVNCHGLSPLQYMISWFSLVAPVVQLSLDHTVWKSLYKQHL